MLIDSNIIIYSTQPAFQSLRNFLGKQNQLTVSVISKIETLGYHQLSSKQKSLLESFFSEVNLIALDDEIVDRAIRLRQTKNIPVADAIIAATALINKLTLVTRNTSDFKAIAGLKVLNPLA